MAEHAVHVVLEPEHWLQGEPQGRHVDPSRKVPLEHVPWQALL